MLRLLPGPHNCSGNHQQHHTQLTNLHSSLKRCNSNIFFLKMQKYRFFPTCRYLFLHKDFLSSVLATDKEDSNELLPTLLPPQHFQKQTRFSVVFEYSLQRGLCCLHGNNTRKPANRDAGRVISILHQCRLCVFIAPMCDSPHTPCTCILSADDPREKNSACAAGQSTEPKEYGADHCLHCTPMISLQRLLAGSVASPGLYLMFCSSISK